MLKKVSWKGYHATYRPISEEDGQIVDSKVLPKDPEFYSRLANKELNAQYAFLEAVIPEYTHGLIHGGGRVGKFSPITYSKPFRDLGLHYALSFDFVDDKCLETDKVTENMIVVARFISATFEVYNNNQGLIYKPEPILKSISGERGIEYELVLNKVLRGKEITIDIGSKWDHIYNNQVLATSTQITDDYWRIVARINGMCLQLFNPTTKRMDEVVNPFLELLKFLRDVEINRDVFDAGIMLSSALDLQDKIKHIGTYLKSHQTIESQINELYENANDIANELIKKLPSKAKQLEKLVI